MKKYFFLLLVLNFACGEKKTADPVQVCKPDPNGKTEIALDSTSQLVATDLRAVMLSLKTFDQSEFPRDKPVADSALHIASVLLSSQIFKATLSKLDFTCKNYWDLCNVSCKNCSDRFSGAIVLDSIFRDKEVELELILNKCGNEFGHSWRHIYKITSCRSVVFYDDTRLSPAHCYAYHIAHEYMHILGFFHTDHKDDVAEKVGLIGWEIMVKWKQSGIDLMKLKPGEI